MTEDEDDDAYEEFKRKKDEGGKQRGRKKKRKVGSSWRETGGKKRVKSEGGDKKPPNQRLWKTASDSSSDQDVGVDVGVEMGLPAYLKARKDAVEAAKAAIEDTDTPPDALRFPPDYGDVYFSDDERLVLSLLPLPYKTPILTIYFRVNWPPNQTSKTSPRAHRIRISRWKTPLV